MNNALVFSKAVGEMTIGGAFMTALGPNWLPDGAELKIIIALTQQAGIRTVENMVVNAGVNFDARAFYHTYASGMSPGR